MTTRTLIPFFTITFGLTWGLAFAYMLFPDYITRVFGELSMTNPLFVCAVYSPGIAGVVLVLYHHGVTGLRAFLGRLLIWHIPTGWALFLLAGIPLMFYSAAALKGTLDEAFFTFDPWYAVLPAIAVTLFLGPVEELGWRGIALPLLQRRYSPIASALILGAIWAIWHIPAFVLSGTPQSGWAFGPYALGVVSLSILLTAQFNRTGGSLLFAALLHFQVNNPVFPDAQPYDTIPFTIAALCAVFIKRNGMFSRAAGTTDVVPKGLNRSGADAGAGIGK